MKTKINRMTENHFIHVIHVTIYYYRVLNNMIPTFKLYHGQNTHYFEIITEMLMV